MGDPTTLTYRMELPAIARLYADNILNEPAIPPLLRDMADEVERLRLTDAEREALHHVVGDVADITGPVEDTIRGLLKRCAIGNGERDNTKG